MKRYIYIFVRKDLSPEQRAVQSCHAAMESGISFGSLNSIYNVKEIISLVLIGVKNKEELMLANNYIESNNIKTFIFIEPSLNLEATSFATECVEETKRYIFKEYKTLRFEKGILYYLKVLFRSIKRELFD